MVALSRRTFLRAAGLGAGSLAAGGALGACSDDAGPGRGGCRFHTAELSGRPGPRHQALFTSHTSGMLPIYTDAPRTYFKSVDRAPGSGGTVTTFQLTWGDPPKPLDKNPYWAELNKRLGVSFEPQFVPQPVFDEKFSTMLASGEVPDLIFMNDQSAVNLQGIRDGAFLDLSEILDGDKILRWPNLAARQEHIWKASLKDGRIYQVPSLVPPITNFPIIRTDLAGQTGVGAAPADADQSVDHAQGDQRPRQGFRRPSGLRGQQVRADHVAAPVQGRRRLAARPERQAGPLDRDRELPPDARPGSPRPGRRASSTRSR